MKRILVITTGSSVATRRGPIVGGALAPLKGDDFQAMLPRAGVELTFEEFSNLPSSHLTPVSALELSRRIDAALASPQVDGVVVTHGTDTLEETAYLLDLTLKSSKPVVCTGAIHAASSPAYDGLLNLAGAIRVAAAPEAQDLGVTIFSDEELHAAVEVQKVHSQSRRAFASPAAGPLGRIDGERLFMYHKPAERQYIACQRLEEMIDLIRLSQGADVRQLRHSVEDGVAGIVIEAFGGGRVPPWWMPVIAEAIQRRTIIAITTRCLVGSLGDEHGYVGAYHDLRRMGVLFAQNLSGPKARIKLMVGLGTARGLQELRTWFPA